MAAARFSGHGLLSRGWKADFFRGRALEGLPGGSAGRKPAARDAALITNVACCFWTEVK